MKDAKKLAELAPKIMNAFHDLGRQHPDKGKLSMRQFQALIILNANQKLTLSQLCGKLSLAPSTGTELVNRMISLEFIEKGQQEGDQRQVFLSVSSKGMALIEERQQAVADMMGRFLEPFDQSDRKKFVQSFEEIWNIISKYQKHDMM